MSQKELVFSVVSAMVEITGDKVVLSKEQIGECALQLTDLTLKGEVVVNGKGKDYSDPAELVKYWRGTVRNWLRRDLRLNGGVKDEPKTKRGPRESDQIKATRGFLASLPEDDERRGDVESEAERALGSCCS